MAHPAKPERAKLTPNVTLPLGGQIRLSDGSTFALESLEIESIAASPQNPRAYPAGSGATARIQLAGSKLTLTRLSAGYDGTPVGWSSGRRVELLDTDGKVAHFAVHHVIDRVVAAQRLRLQRGATVRVLDSLDVKLVGHSHKDVMPGDTSPLLVTIDYHDGQPPVPTSLFPPNAASWDREDLRFTMTDYVYGERMGVDVVRLALEPLDPSR